MDENGAPRTGRPHTRVVNLADGGLPIGPHAALPQPSACHDYGHDDARDRGILTTSHRRPLAVEESPGSAPNLTQGLGGEVAPIVVSVALRAPA